MKEKDNNLYILLIFFFILIYLFYKGKKCKPVIKDLEISDEKNKDEKIKNVYIYNFLLDGMKRKSSPGVKF